MWYDRDIDALMERTRKRPIPAGRAAPDKALAFGVTLALFSVMLMGVALNWTAAALLALAIGFYVFVYTVWLKRRTPQNIVIGGAAGALPPMIGWAAVTGAISLHSIALFLIIFMWTPPHFWALALHRAGDYAKAGVPMLPVGRRQGRDQAPNPDLYVAARAAQLRAAGPGHGRDRLRRGRRVHGHLLSAACSPGPARAGRMRRTAYVPLFDPLSLRAVCGAHHRARVGHGLCAAGGGLG